MIHTSDEGTSYCPLCEAAAKERDFYKAQCESLVTALKWLVVICETLPVEPGLPEALLSAQKAIDRAQEERK